MIDSTQFYPQVFIAFGLKMNDTYSVMKKLNKKILLVLSSAFSLFFVLLQTKDSQILNNITSIDTANADYVDPGCACGFATAVDVGGCGSSGGSDGSGGSCSG